MKTKNICKLILTAAVCSVFLTACGSEKDAKKSSDKSSGADVNAEKIDIKIPENAVYCQTDKSYIKGKLSAITLHYYDEHDHIIYLFSQPTEDSDDEFAAPFDCSYSYKYNDDGTIAEMSIIESDDIQTMEYEYNDDKTVRTETGYRNGELWFTTVSTYDEHSNPVQTEMTFPDANSSFISNYEYEYDPDGRILVEKCTKDNELSNYTKRYTYDKNGNTASLEATYAYLDYPQLTKYTYNSDNRLIKEQNFADGKELEYTEYEYEFYN